MERDIETYRTIIRAIQETGGIIAHNWVETAALRAEFPEDQMWWHAMHNAVQDNLHDVDLVIAEASGASGLGVGYELACALNAHMPVLALVQKDTQGSSYAIGISDDYLECRTYEKGTLASIVKEFIASKKTDDRGIARW